MGELGSSLKVGYAAAQFAPLFLTFFIAFFGPIDLELFGMNNGRRV
jgi:hypothetical protein